MKITFNFIIHRVTHGEIACQWRRHPGSVILAAVAAPARRRHSCTSSSNTQFFGDPAVRQQSLACDASYASSLTALAQKSVARVQ